MEGVSRFSRIYSFPQFIKSFKTIVPLSNFQIIEKCKELSIKNFRGVFMRDELKELKSCRNECLILNHDHSSNEGTHWTCLFIKDTKYYMLYFILILLEMILYWK